MSGLDLKETGVNLGNAAIDAGINAGMAKLPGDIAETVADLGLKPELSVGDDGKVKVHTGDTLIDAAIDGKKITERDVIAEVPKIIEVAKDLFSLFKKAFSKKSKHVDDDTHKSVKSSLKTTTHRAEFAIPGTNEKGSVKVNVKNNTAVAKIPTSVADARGVAGKLSKSGAHTRVDLEALHKAMPDAKLNKVAAGMAKNARRAAVAPHRK